jgi:UDP-N-acetylmuramate--alanine ligase
MYLKKYQIHFVGIGGIGMSGIAELLLNLGYKVSGSDVKASEITTRLKSLGGTVYKGHKAVNIKNADVVVVSSAIGVDNPEVAAAQQKAVPVIPRAEMLAELMRLKFSIAIAGAHGKTSTTSMVAAVLGQGGLDPTVVIGGKLISVDTNALLGQGDFIVAEADESDGSFLRYSPAIAVVTNIDREHLDFYKDLDAIKEVFLRFIDRIPFYGLAILCLDNESVQEIIPKIKKRFTTYGMSSQADLQAQNIVFEGITSRYDVYHQKEFLGQISLNLPGMHNIYNSMAAIAVGLELEIPFDEISAAFRTLTGVRRRMEIKGERKGVLVVDDYGHHPTEIKTTLTAARDTWSKHRKVVVFQPHRYTRTQALFDDFTRAFYESDVLIVLPIYAASETEIEGVTSAALVEGIKAHGHKEVVQVSSANQALKYLTKHVKPKDLVITLGAGDVFKLGEKMLEVL